LNKNIPALFPRFRPLNFYKAALLIFYSNFQVCDRLPQCASAKFRGAENALQALPFAPKKKR